MRASVMAAFPGFTTGFEGRLAYMYTDALGLVTTATGNLIDPVPAAMVLPWKHVDGSAASTDEIQAEWQAVKAAWPGIQSAACRSITTLHLEQAAIDNLLVEKAHANEDTLRGAHPDFDNLPADAQLGLHSMAWAMGAAFHFPQFTAGINNKDFATAAAQCHMQGTGIDARNAADVVLFNNAAAVQAAGGDPDVLYYPAKIAIADVVPPGAGGASSWKTFAGIGVAVLAAGAGAYALIKGGKS
jgi:GH24 family phage-related lysozyme (muramidase)